MSLIGSTNEQKIWNYLYDKLGNAYGVAGIMGNMMAESGLKPTNLQNTYEKKLGYTDASYTAAVDNGTYTNFIYDKAGYGLVQWTYWSLKRDLYNYVKSAGKSIGDLETQLEFLCKQLSEGYSAVWSTCKSATTVLEASNAMLLKFERPADQSVAVQNKRAGYGQTYYDKYATKVSVEESDTETKTEDKTSEVKTNTTFPTVPFIVKVLISDLNYRSSGSMNGKILGQTGKGSFTITEVNSAGWGKLKSGAGWIYLKNASCCTIGKSVASSPTATSFTAYKVRVVADTLNIRKGAGTNYGKNGAIKDHGVYTIVAESNGKGATKWGKLKSGAGWISLDYCKKV